MRATLGQIGWRWLALGALAGLTSWAQEAPQDGRRQERLDEGTLVYEYGFSWEEGAERLWLFQGNVELQGRDQTLRADRLLAWTRLDDPKLKLREVYAEGNVVFRRTDPKTKDVATLRAERLYYDFTSHKAFVIDLRAMARQERIGTPVVITAREARAASRGRWEASDVSLTTCDYGVPHYHLRFSKASLRGRKPEPDPDPYDLWPYRDWSVRGEGLAADVFGVPIFFWPVIAFGSAISEFPIKAVKAGHTSRFGYWVESEWAVTINKGLVDSLNPGDASTAEDDDEKWGEVGVEIDWRRKRGWGGGLDLQWKWSGYEGYVDTYFLHDKGGDPDIPFDAQFLPLEREDRSRVRLFHRHELAEGLRFELELSYLSDRSLLAEFFEKEFKEGKEQEAVAYLRWTEGPVAAYLMDRHRLNDFQTQIEYLPRGRFFLYELPIVGGITYHVEADAAHLRARFDDALDLPHAEVDRLDLIQEIARPFDLDVAALTPFLRVRNTVYHEDLEGDTEYRLLATAGARLTTRLQGIHDLTWEAVGLRRLRHVATFEARYTNNVENSLEPSELLGFDEVDALDEFEELSLEMRHRFETKVLSEGHLVTHPFLELGAAAEYYPDSDRDTVSSNVNSFMDPFTWIFVKPTAPGGPMERRHWSNVHWDAAFRLRQYFAVTAAGEYNPVDRQEEARQIAISFDPLPTLHATAGEVFLREVTNAFTAELEWEVTDKWRIAASAQYDFDDHEYISRRGTVSRDFHDFVLEAVWEADEGRDERRFYVTVFPKFARKRP